MPARRTRAWEKLKTPRRVIKQLMTEFLRGSEWDRVQHLGVGEIWVGEDGPLLL